MIKHGESTLNWPPNCPGTWVHLFPVPDGAMLAALVDKKLNTQKSGEATTTGMIVPS